MKTEEPRTWSSPSAAVRTRTLDTGRPTEPSRNPVRGLLAVVTPAVSVRPHASMTTMPKPAQNRTTSSGIGADALAAQATRSRPPAASRGSSTVSRHRAYASASAAGGSSPRSRKPTCSRATSAASATALRRSSGSRVSPARTAAASFSQTLGTPKNCRGRSSRTASATVAGSAQRWTCEARWQGR